MRYLLLINIDAGLLEALPAEEYDALMRDCIRHADALKAEGVLVDSQRLGPPAAARTLRERGGELRVTDGPFAETRELLAGFNLVNARDAGEAEAIARGFPWYRYGSVEVRPVEDFEAERARVGA